MEALKKISDLSNNMGDFSGVTGLQIISNDD